MSDLTPKPSVPAPPTSASASASAPAPRALDRASLERVLARAAELQGTDADPSDALSEQQLLEIAREVGISPDALRVALAEERTRVTLPQESGLAARIAGPALVGASRVVKGNVAGVLATLDDWMRRGECLQPKRRQTDRLSWEPRRDMLGRMKVGLNLGGRGYHLARAAEVAATAVPVDAERVHVQLVADVGPARRSRLLGGAPDPAVAVISAGAALVTGAGLVGGRFVARSHLVTARRVQVGLEQLLDRLEHGELRGEGTDPRQLLQGLIQDALRPRRPG
jgi:hypothetical protein